MRFGQNKFLDRYDPTIEEEYEVTVEYEGRRSIVSRGHTQTRAAHRDATRRLAKLNIIDTAGIEQFTGINESYIQEIPIVIVGTKMDLTAEREVSSQAIQELALQWGVPFYETSAKKGWHVNEVFNDLLSRMRKRYPDGIAQQKKRRRDQCHIM
ncbi:hypothetical protein BN946_scf184705.g3 [Trametes cinnabarina]|uniref:Uncharacterized protein n=1 Tax=Pycnoporus cinnabarinus TaxID=5643 RepID=A0A060SXC2_PYCCI|nr:hypothetical protein BN946_scf184705.g3 [Trametes cinnabarina]